MSSIIRAIIFGGGETPFWLAMVAIIAPFLPFLLLPKLLESAIASLGKLGGTLTTLGNGLRTGLKRGEDSLRSTEAYKSAEEQARRMQDYKRSGLAFNRKTGELETDANGNPIERKTNRFQRFMYGGDIGQRRARARVVGHLEAKVAEDNLMSEGGIAAAMAGVEAKAEAQQTANSEAILSRGNARLEDGSVVNVNDEKSLGAFHQEALGRYQNADTAEKRETAAADIRAAQNMLSKTKNGRAQVSENLETAVKGGQASALAVASAHLQSNYGDLYKQKDRGAHKLISDLASAGRSENGEIANLANIQNNLNNDVYNYAGTDSYTAETLINADDRVFDNMLKSIEDNRITDTAYEEIVTTINKALEMQRDNKLDIKADVQTRMKDILNAKRGSKGGAAPAGTPASGGATPTQSGSTPTPTQSGSTQSGSTSSPRNPSGQLPRSANMSGINFGGKRL